MSDKGLLMAQRKTKAHLELHDQIKIAQGAIEAALTDTTVLAFLADHGCTATRLREGKTLCMTAQQAANNADIAIIALKTWMDQFLALAQVALQPRPDLMSKLQVQSKATRAKDRKVIRRSFNDKLNDI